MGPSLPPTNEILQEDLMFRVQGLGFRGLGV